MIYLDNSATTNPKPLNVINAVNIAMKRYSFNSGRGGYKQSVDTAERIFAVREKAADLTGYQPQNIVFTQNCTLALNMAIKGLVKKGDHILISNLEHNAVSRPVDTLAKKGVITYSTFSYNADDEQLTENIKSLIRPNTSLLVCTQASNVFGCAFPIEKISRLAKANGIYFVVDGAQGAGLFALNCQQAGVTAYCAAGHKGLYGPMSTGFIATDDDVLFDTIVEGGTGSSSLILSQPDYLPDRLESGTLNNSGVIGLGAGIDFVMKKGIEKIYNHELGLVRFVYRELEKDGDAVLYTPIPESGRFAPILSFNYKDYQSEKTAALLAEKGIAVRAGLHCAPLAHKAFSTQDRGTVRFSPSAFTTLNDCEKFLNSLKKL